MLATVFTVSKSSIFDKVNSLHPTNPDFNVGHNGDVECDNSKENESEKKEKKSGKSFKKKLKAVRFVESVRRSVSASLRRSTSNRHEEEKEGEEGEDATVPPTKIRAEDMAETAQEGEERGHCVRHPSERTDHILIEEEEEEERNSTSAATTAVVGDNDDDKDGNETATRVENDDEDALGRKCSVVLREGETVEPPKSVLDAHR